MPFCSSCGNEVAPDVSFCPKCGKQLVAENTLAGMSNRPKKSKWWYLVPILLGIVGSVIAYLILKDDDPKLAKNCLWLGIILTVISFIIGLIFGLIFAITQSDYLTGLHL